MAGVTGGPPQQLCLIPTSLPITTPRVCPLLTLPHPNLPSPIKSIHWLLPPFLLVSGKVCQALADLPIPQLGHYRFEPPEMVNSQ